MLRRNFLKLLSCVPFLGWVKPEESEDWMFVKSADGKWIPLCPLKPMEATKIEILPSFEATVQMVPPTHELEWVGIGLAEGESVMDDRKLSDRRGVPV